jgi:predicted ArsR family transcriptional regulator
MTGEAAMQEALQACRFEHDTVRVLVHLFKTEAKEDRDIIAIAKQLAMVSNVVRYHLDQLTVAGLADMESGKYVYGRVYWGSTTAGRKYVVERKLI